MNIEEELKSEYSLATYTSTQMIDRLEEVRKTKGKFGWYDCNKDILIQGLAVSIADQDMLDIINYAAMLHFRENIRDSNNDR